MLRDLVAQRTPTRRRARRARAVQPKLPGRPPNLPKETKEDISDAGDDDFFMDGYDTPVPESLETPLEKEFRVMTSVILHYKGPHTLSKWWSDWSQFSPEVQGRIMATGLRVFVSYENRVNASFLWTLLAWRRDNVYATIS